MTTIALKDGVVAADTAISYGTTVFPNGPAKIFRDPATDTIGGACGRTTYLERFSRWFLSRGYLDQTEPPKSEDCAGFVYFPSGKILVVDDGGTYEMTTPYFAIGSGTDFALGAMASGANAAAAVRAAMAHDAHSGGDVHSLRINHWKGTKDFA